MQCLVNCWVQGIHVEYVKGRQEVLNWLDMSVRDDLKYYLKEMYIDKYSISFSYLCINREWLGLLDKTL